MHLIDSNIFLEIHLGQENKEYCKRYLTKVGKGDIKAFVTLFHADNVALKIEDAREDKECVKSFFNDLKRFRGLKVIETDFQTRIDCLEGDFDIGLDDSLIIKAYRDFEADILVSYDSDFDSFEDVTRKTPSEVLEK